jgi:hypothetical protein
VVRRIPDDPNGFTRWMTVFSGAGNGDGMDVWFDASDSSEVVGMVCMADVFKRAAELNILLGCSSDEIVLVSSFLNDIAGLSCLVIEPDSPSRDSIFTIPHGVDLLGKHRVGHGY